MSQAKPPRVWVSNANPKKGEVLRVRAQMEHVMESGLRTDPATGKVRPRNIVNRFEERGWKAMGEKQNITLDKVREIVELSY